MKRFWIGGNSPERVPFPLWLLGKEDTRDTQHLETVFVERAIAKHDKTLLDAGQVDGHRVSSYGVGSSSKNVLALLLALAKVNRGRPGQEKNSVGRFVTLRKTVVQFADVL